MSLSDYSFEQLLPIYLTSTDKDRFKILIDQFFKKETHIDDKSYEGFYLDNSPDYLLQSDLLNSVKGIDWNQESEEYTTGYTSGMIISNTCDISAENPRTINVKQALIAPIIPIKEYIQDLHDAGYSKNQTNTFYRQLKDQGFSNLFYLPAKNEGGDDFIVFFDKIFWHPISNLKIIQANISEDRFASLSNFGFYLFVAKISYHFCRLPEEKDR